MKYYVESVIFCYIVLINYAICCDYECYDYLNGTEPADKQLYEFKLRHPKPIGILTTDAGKFVDIRETISLNSDAFSNQYFIEDFTHSNAERIPERVVHAKGAFAHGYFKVTHDVSRYTMVDAFNGVGKITPLAARFSATAPSIGGSDLAREHKGLAVKLYTKEGNFDIVCISFPVFFFNDPLIFTPFLHSVKKNPKTGLDDMTMRWDFVTKRAESINAELRLLSDLGIPNGYRKMNAHAVHTFGMYNKLGEIYFVRFNFITNQGIENLSSEVAATITSQDPDYFKRDLYNAIENKNYPSWTLEMYVMSSDDVTKLDYNPFDVTREWKNGTYKNVPIGRVVLNRNPKNTFNTAEQGAFHPGNLVPGLIAPPDDLFKSRLSSYRNAQEYRLGVNHDKIEVNRPLYQKNYNRDGDAPVRNNMNDAPNYYPNSFNGPVPHIDSSRPKEKFIVYNANVVDLEPAADFYNNYLQSDTERQRLANNTVASLLTVSPEIQRRVIRLFNLTDEDLGRKVSEGLKIALRISPPRSPPVLKMSRDNVKKEEHQIFQL